jgi:hypothetical protein
MSIKADIKTQMVDPTVVKHGFYDLNSKTSINVGRGVKKYLGDLEFKFFSIDWLDKKDTSDTTANFCLATCSFDYGKEKQRLTFVSYGPPARVLDSILKEIESGWHEDIIDWFTSKKLQFIEDSFRDNKKYTASEKLAISMKAVFEGFEKGRIATGKPAPQYFKEHNLDFTKSLADKIKKDVDHVLPYYVKNNPFAFKSAATKEVVDEKIYQSLTPAEILTQRLALTNVSVPQLAAALKFDISTVYHHIRGTRDVDRKAALRYASYFNCDPSDILFPPIKIPLTGTCDFIKNYKDLKPCEVEIKYKEVENVLCPRDFYTNAKEIKAIKINSVNSVYNNHIAYYYYSEKKEADCENKICFVGVDNGLTILDGNTDYFIGIYENYRGNTKILNPDPYRNKEVILENPKIKFITPIVGIVNIEKVQFSPVVEVSMKALSANEKLKKLEKDLELAEDQWWIENQKLASGKKHHAMTKARSLDKMYKDLKEQRLAVDALRRQVLERELEKKHNNIDQKLSKFISDLYYDEDQKRA